MDSSSTNSNSNLITFPCTSNDTNSIPLLSKEQLNSLCGVKLVNDVCDAGNSSDPTQKFLSRTSLPPGSRVIEPGQMVTMDFVEGRLNLHINAEGMVSKAKYG